NKPEADAEILMLTNSLMEKAGLKSFAFKVGHVGVLRSIFRQEKLDERVQNQAMQLMDKKLYDDAFNVIREAGVSAKCLEILNQLVKLRGTEIFDVAAKMKECVKDYAQSVSAVENLGEILNLVSQCGCKINMIVDAGFARGLEYYTGMIFEVYVLDLDIALGGGGRYDRLIELFGGESTPAVGVAHGIDRIMLALQEQKAKWTKGSERRVMVIPINEKLRAEALKFACMLREAGVSTEVEVMGRKMAKALEDADKRDMDFALIVGEKELKEGAVVIKDLKKREQNTVQIEKMLEVIKTQ
ncbi:MAG TPA: HisS family protein, partial [Candidatus Bathyarchaeia archaeon]|nr:HisS family protein [Candidatus Bathyarchaeia archaeon]